MPPFFTLGHEIFSSTASAIPERAIFLATSTYSLSLDPATFTHTGTSKLDSHGKSFSIKTSRPLFSKPMELSKPDDTSHSRGGGLPSHGCKVTALVINPPSDSLFIHSEYSLPLPKVPEHTRR